MILCRMAEIEAEVRRWGNSLGIIIPADVVQAEGLKPHDRALVRIVKVRFPDPGSFGMLKDWKIDPQKMKDEIRAEERGRERRRGW